MPSDPEAEAVQRIRRLIGLRDDDVSPHVDALIRERMKNYRWLDDAADDIKRVLRIIT